MILFLVLIFALLTGCANIETVATLDPKIYYKPDVTIKVKNKKYFGWGVLPYSNEYKLDIRSPGKIDLLKISTCARLDTDEPEGKIFFKSTKSYEYKYIINSELEEKGSCLLRIEGYEAGVPGRHAYGVFERDAGPGAVENYPADITCNARKTKAGPVSMCVLLEGLEQQIVFNEPMKLSKDILQNCKIPIPSDGKKWTFPTPNRECVYLFENIEDYNKKHRHHSIGYEDIAIRRHR